MFPNNFVLNLKLQSSAPHLDFRVNESFENKILALFLRIDSSMILISTDMILDWIDEV